MYYRDKWRLSSATARICTFVANNRSDTTNSELPLISCETVLKQLNQISASKACGPDNILNLLLNDYSDNLATPLCKIINSSSVEKTASVHLGMANVTLRYMHRYINDDLRPISLQFHTVSKIAADYVVNEHAKPAVLRQVGHNRYTVTIVLAPT